MGYSLGGAFSLLLTGKDPSRFNGMSLVAPYLGLHDPTELEKILPIAKIMNYVVPTFKVSFKPPIDRWFKDMCGKNFEGDRICFHNIVSNDQ